MTDSNNTPEVFSLPFRLIKGSGIVMGLLSSTRGMDFFESSEFVRSTGYRDREFAAAFVTELCWVVGGKAGIYKGLAVASEQKDVDDALPELQSSQWSQYGQSGFASIRHQGDLVAFFPKSRFDLVTLNSGELGQHLTHLPKWPETDFAIWVSRDEPEWSIFDPHGQSINIVASVAKSFGLELNEVTNGTTTPDLVAFDDYRKHIELTLN